MAFILLADLHLGLNKDNPIFHDVALNLFNEIGDVCTRENITQIIHFGDLFHNRKYITQKTLDVAREIFEKNSHLDFYLIRGNHDSFFKDLPFPNWLTNFKKYYNVIVIEDNYKILNNICMVPWAYSLDNLPKNRDKLYLFGHFEINGFCMNDGVECRKGHYSSSDFKDFKHVFSGHFHFPSSKENITYLGSPYQQNFGDCGNARGYYIFNDGYLNFIEFESAPKFYKIHTEDLKDQKSLIKGNFIKLIFSKNYGAEKNISIVEEVESLDPLKLITDASNIEELNENVELDEDDIKDTDNLLMDYLNRQELPEHIKRETLYQFINKLINDN
jgi:DNA repair exonuclease SbcCD nuclease subunit